MFSRLRKLQDALSAIVQVPLAAAAADTEVLSPAAFHVLPGAAVDVQVPPHDAAADTEALYCCCCTSSS